MRGTVIAKHRGRCTRNLLVINLFVLTAVAFIVWAAGDYFLRLLTGHALPPGVTARPSWVEYVLAAVLLGTGSLALWNVLKAVYRLTPAGRESHPVVRDLCRFGDRAVVAAAVTAEVCDGAECFCKRRVVLTHSWLLHATPFSLSVIRLDDVVWAFEKVTEHRGGLLPSRDYAVIVRDARGWEWEIRGPQKDVDRLLAVLGTRLPWIYHGYAEAWERDWLLHRAAMVQAVAFRRGLTLFALEQSPAISDCSNR